MENMHSARALRPVDTEPGVLVHSSADRQLAIEQWLLATDPSSTRVRMEWQKGGLALLPLGGLMSAVRIPQQLIMAVADSEDRGTLDAFLGAALDGGPVICDPAGRRYYALVGGTMPERYPAAAEDWRVLGVDCLGRDHYLGVPRVQAVEFNSQTLASYWSVPMPSAGVLCSHLAVARLIAAAQSRLEERAEA